MTRHNLITEPCDLPSNWKFIDITGQIFNDLTVLHYVGARNRQSLWLCQCKCGTLTNATLTGLKDGRPRSCGCSRRKHPKHPLLQTWKGILRRCTDPRNPSYVRYGGRGITVSDEWLDFETFAQDMGKRPTPQHSIERRDNNKGYSADNCYWGTKKEQANNTRRNVLITIDGRTQNVMQWAEEKGLTANRIYYRIRLGWNPVEAVTVPILRRGGKYHKMRPRRYEPIKRTSRLITYKGETKTVTEWARQMHLDVTTVRGRLKAGWPLEDALTQPPLKPKLRKTKAF